MCCLGRKGDKDVFQDEIEENGARHVLMMLLDGAVLQKDGIFEGRINIRSKTGEPKGWMKKDLFLPNLQSLPCLPRRYRISYWG